jgi:hypothetical protein
MAFATHAGYSALNQFDADDISHKPSAWPPPLQLAVSTNRHKLSVGID